MNLPEYANFNIMVDGTTNLTTVLDAPAFASQGNFYLLSTDPQAQSSLPLDFNGTCPLPDASTGNSFFVIEKYSGTTL